MIEEGGWNMNQTLEIAKGENATRSYDFRYTFGSALLR